MFIRRDRRPANRLTPWRVALVFLAAGIWLGGVLTENHLATGAAIVVLLAAIALGYVGRERGG